MPAEKETAKPAPDDTRKVKQIGRYIVADPNICHGRLTFRGTRVFVSDILEDVEAGLPFDMIAENWHGLSIEAIKEAVRLARLTFIEHASEYSPERKAG